MGIYVIQHGDILQLCALSIIIQPDLPKSSNESY